MSKTIDPPPDVNSIALNTLRTRIDALDAQMHQLLMERGEIIDALIETKKSRETGSAFRPAREASMMRMLAERHHGSLPLETVEGIWRTMIGTFTWLQMPYGVHADTSLGASVIQDVARFHFGFSPALSYHKTPQDVINAVRLSMGDVGIIRFEPHAISPWWTALVGEDAPKIIARLPFIERSQDSLRTHPVGTSAFVISNPLNEGIAPDSVLFSLVLAAPLRADHVARLRDKGCEVVCHAIYQEGVCVLIDGDCRHTPEHAIIGSINDLLSPRMPPQIIGSHAARFVV
jgi:chorismate mutase